MFDTMKAAIRIKEARRKRNVIKSREQDCSLLLSEAAKAAAQKRIYSTIRAGLLY